METVLKYHGHTIYPYNYKDIYCKGDYVLYCGYLFQSIVDFNVREPSFSSKGWATIGPVNLPVKNSDKNECGNHIGNIKADNAVVYGNNTGNIIANGEKSVVVVFGDVVGNIEADQVIHVHDVDKTKIEEALAHVKDRRF